MACRAKMPHGARQSLRSTAPSTTSTVALAPARRCGPSATPVTSSTSWTRRRAARSREAGTLTDLEGIGPSHRRRHRRRRRRTPERLSRQARGASPGSSSATRAPRSAPRSGATATCTPRGRDGRRPIEAMARAAMALGHEYMVLTDHSPRLTIAHGLSPERLAPQRDEIAALNAELAPFRILRGVEVDILEDGGARPPRGGAPGRSRRRRRRRCTRKLRMAEHEMTRRMVMAVASPHVDILGHCTGRQIVGTAATAVATSTPRSCSRRAPEFDTAVEINCRPERQDPPDELLELALRVGLPRLDRHRRPRARPARMAAVRMRQGGPTRHRARPHRQHEVGRRPRRLGRVTPVLTRPARTPASGLRGSRSDPPP